MKSQIKENLSKKIVTMCFIFSGTFAGVTRANEIVVNPSDEAVTVSMDTFKEEVKRNALILDKAELGMERLYTEKSILTVDDVKCPYTIKIKEVIIGVESDGMPKLNREPVVELENKDPICVGYSSEMTSELFLLGSVESFLTDLSEMPSQFIIEKIGNLKYRIKGIDTESGGYGEMIFDLNKPLFLNPVELLLRGTGDFADFQSTTVISEIH